MSNCFHHKTSLHALRPGSAEQSPLSEVPPICGKLTCHMQSISFKFLCKSFFWDHVSSRLMQHQELRKRQCRLLIFRLSNHGFNLCSRCGLAMAKEGICEAKVAWLSNISRMLSKHFLNRFHEITYVAIHIRMDLHGVDLRPHFLLKNPSVGRRERHLVNFQILLSLPFLSEAWRIQSS